MKTGILAAGITPAELLDRHGSYADMIMTLLGPEHDYTVFDVRDGVFPRTLAPFDSWVITGSRCAVYEDLPWMRKLKQLVLQVYDAGTPMVGICFGHQLIASAFGARVARHRDGWGVGLHTYAIEGEHHFLDAGERRFTINAMHQDQVLDLPRQATVFASSGFCPYAGLVYDKRILTLQAHPEFSIGFERELLQSRRGTAVPEAAADQGLATLTEDARTDSVRVARWINRFLAGSEN